MITNFIKSIFGGGSSEKESVETSQETTGVVTTQVIEGEDSGYVVKANSQTGKADLEKFVEFIVRGLVDKPEEVKIVVEPSETGNKVIRICCCKEDIGKVVGKRGKTIISIRALVNGAAGRMQQRVCVEVMD